MPPIGIAGRGIMSPHTLDTFVAPHLSELTECNAPDLEDVVKSSGLWLVHFVMNSSLRINYGPKGLIMGFLRRSQAAVDEYRLGRQHLLAWVSANRETRRLSDILNALRHMEAAIGLLYQALLLAHQVAKQVDPTIGRLYTSGDGSPEGRMGLLYNASRHSDERLAKSASEGLTSPVWLTNAGIEATGARLLWTELEGLVGALASTATYLSNPPDQQPPSRDKGSALEANAGVRSGG
jgi:hypothetical protein